MNNVNLIGRLTKAPELKQTASNTSVLTGTLAVNRTFKNQNGEREADFINIVAWRQTADIIAQYCGKGSQIGITGRIQTRNYENQQGQRVYVTEVVADSFHVLESRGNGAQSKDATQSPFSNSEPMDISNSDLPF